MGECFFKGKAGFTKLIEGAIFRPRNWLGVRQYFTLKGHSLREGLKKGPSWIKER